MKEGKEKGVSDGQNEWLRDSQKFDNSISPIFQIILFIVQVSPVPGGWHNLEQKELPTNELLRNFQMILLSYHFRFTSLQYAISKCHEDFCLEII